MSDFVELDYDKGIGNLGYRGPLTTQKGCDRAGHYGQQHSSQKHHEVPSAPGHRVVLWPRYTTKDTDYFISGV